MFTSTLCRTAVVADNSLVSPVAASWTTVFSELFYRNNRIVRTVVLCITENNLGVRSVIGANNLVLLEILSDIAILTLFPVKWVLCLRKMAWFLDQCYKLDNELPVILKRLPLSAKGILYQFTLHVGIPGNMMSIPLFQSTIDLIAQRRCRNILHVAYNGSACIRTTGVSITSTHCEPCLRRVYSGVYSLLYSKVDILLSQRRTLFYALQILADVSRALIKEPFCWLVLCDDSNHRGTVMRNRSYTLNELSYIHSITSLTKPVFYLFDQILLLSQHKHSCLLPPCPLVKQSAYACCTIRRIVMLCIFCVIHDLLDILWVCSWYKPNLGPPLQQIARNLDNLCF